MQSHYIDEKIFEWVFRLTAWCNVSSGLMQWDISSGFSGLQCESRLTAWCNVSSGLMRWVISSGFSDFSFFETRWIFIFCRQCMNDVQNIRAKQASARNFDDFRLVVHIWRWGNALPEALASHLVFSILCWVRKGQKCRKVMMVRTVVQIVFLCFCAQFNVYWIVGSPVTRSIFRKPIHAMKQWKPSAEAWISDALSVSAKEILGPE